MCVSSQTSVISANFKRLSKVKKNCRFKAILAISAHIFAKFKYFEKQFILMESPDHVLLNDI